ncbi:MAG: hypothetical protein JSU04_10035 [Bdellovibrionales bacterium]|nr:hypothetical protein [Bdellovibrionales bacterium]
MRFTLCLLFLVLLGHQTMAAEALCSQVFKINLTPAERLSNLEKKFSTEIKVVLDEKGHKEDAKEYKIRLKHADGYTMGYVLFLYNPKKHLLDIESMDVLTDFKKSGVGEVLMDQALLRFETEQIAVESLASDNDAILQHGLMHGLSPMEAIQQTPAYKIRQKLGFTEIIPESINAHFGFIVRRR